MSRLTTFPVRTAQWSATHPWRAIAGWLAFVALAVGLAMAVPTKSTVDADYRIGESGRAAAMLEDAKLGGAPTETILIAAASGRLDLEQAAEAAAGLTAALPRVAGVATVGDPVWNAERSAAFIEVTLDEGVEDVTAVQAATDGVQQRFPGLSVRQTGDVSLDDGINAQVAKDLGSAEVTSVPVTLVLMLLAFGALIAAGVPVLFAGTSVAATMGLAAPISHLIHAEPTVSSMIVLIGMAVGVDYSLFYLKREREERAAGHSRLDAVAIAAKTSGHAIVVSGAAVIASMAGLFLVGSATFNSLAAGAIVVVAVAVLGSITVLPALLVKLGRWVDRPRVPLLWRLTRRIGRGGISTRLLRPVLEHPAIALVLGTVVIGLLAAPALGMRVHNANLQTLPAAIPEVATMNALSAAFPAQGASATVVVSGPAADAPARARALTALNGAAGDSPLFAPATSAPIETSTDGTTSALRVTIPFPESDDRVEQAVRTLRGTLAPDALDSPGLTYAVGGGAAESLDYSDRQGDRMPYVIGFVLLLTFTMILITFRSLPAALISTVFNLLSVGVAFGVLRLVFQDGWLSGPLGFTAPGFVVNWIPLFVMAILLGLSMDYHIFVLSRIREYVTAGVDPREAVARGIRDTAGVVTSAAAVMVSVFAIFATMSMLEMKMMGLGLAVAIFLDATIIRLVMLPAALVLLGERAWWPGRPASDPAPTTVSGAAARPELVGAS